jgi:hypothetical protein
VGASTDPDVRQTVVSGPGTAFGLLERMRIGESHRFKSASSAERSAGPNELALDQ